MQEVVYEDHMGSDLSVVNAARVSFNKKVEQFGVKDGGLVRFLARNDHWTPFAHTAITLREKVPIFVARQRFKHTVGFVYNEVSRRYVDDTPEFFYPDEWRSRPDESIKQGSGGPVSAQGYCNTMYQSAVNHCEDVYQCLLRQGVAPEQARMVLPQSMFTEYYVTGSLAAFARAYKLRVDSHAQKEIQELASYWGEIIEPLFPVSWAALTQD